MEKAGNPVMKQMKDGCWTLKARSVLPSSSAVNWASMIMGAEKNQRSCSYIPISRTARGMVSGTTFPGIMNKCIRTTFY
nr:hypothetical protein [Chitinophaga chungangae]